MAVVKNLMVRLGADIRGYVAGMKNAGNVTSQETGIIKQSFEGTKKGIASSVGGSRMTLRQYSEQIGKLEQKYRLAEQGTERLKDKISGLKSVYKVVETATANIDLSKSLTDQIANGEKELLSLAHRSREVERELKRLGGGNTKSERSRVAKLEEELRSLSIKTNTAVRHMETLNQAADRVGSANMRYASDSGLKQLAKEIAVAENELRTMEAQAQRTKQALDSMSVGSYMKQSLTAGLKSLGASLKNLVSGAVSGLKSIGSRLLDIGRNAKNSHSRADRLGSALKKIGLAAGALRLVSAVTGRLRSIVSSYISENAALQAQVNALKSSLGSALAPAINLVTNALSAMMPYIVGVSNAIGALISNLFGGGWTTVAQGASAAAAATGSAAGAQEEYNRALEDFDEITKLSHDSSGGGGGGGNSSGSANAVQGALPGWLTDLGSRIQTAIAADNWEGVGAAIADKLGEAVDKVRTKLSDSSFTGKVRALTDKAASVFNGFFAEMTYSDETTHSIAWNTGAMVGDAVSLGLNTVHQSLTTAKFGSIGESVAQGINGALNRLSESSVSLGTIIADAINSGVSAAVGLVRNLDWSELGRTIVRNIMDLITNIDYAEIVSGIGSLLGGIGVSVCTLIYDGVTNVTEYFAQSIEEAGGSIGKGIWNGIKKSLLSGLDWIMDNVLIPFVEGLAEQFDGIPILGDAFHSALGGLNKFDLYIDGIITGLDTRQVDGETVSVTGNATKIKDLLPVSSKVIDATARYCNAKNALPSGQMIIPTTAKYTRATDGLTTISKTISTTAAFTGAKDSLSAAQKTFATTANYTGFKDSLSAAQKTVSATANFTSFKDSLTNKTTNFSANINSFTDKLTGKNTNFNANINTFSDGIKDKRLSFSANVEKGWTGSLEGQLGISTLYSKLKVDAGYFDVTWSTSSKGGSTVNTPKIKQQFNARGGILNSEQILGMIGDTLQIGGEAGREALLPLDSHTGWMDDIADRVAQRVSGGQSAAQDITVQLVLDGKIITQTVVRNVNAQARATGINPLAATM